MALRKDRGVALVQVLVMSVLLLILAAGVLQVVFGTHMLVARNQSSDKSRYWLEACQSRLNAAWSGAGANGVATPCALVGTAKSTPAEVCDFSAETPGAPTKDNWTITCDVVSGKVSISIHDWPP
jgi:hypothetical protein